MSGFIQLERSFFNTPEWKEQRSLSDAEAMLYLIGKAGFEAKTALYRGKYISLQAGELIASERYLAQEWLWYRTKLVRFLKRATQKGYIARRVSRGVGIIKVQGFVAQYEACCNLSSDPLNNLDSRDLSQKVIHPASKGNPRAIRAQSTDEPILNNINNNNNLNNKTPYSPPFISKKIEVFSEQPAQGLSKE